MKIRVNNGDQYESADPQFFQLGGEVGGNGMVYAGNYRQVDTRPMGTSTSGTKDSSGSGSKSKKGLIGDDLISNLIGKGITSDVDASVRELMEMQALFEELSDVDKSSREGMILLNKMLVLSTQVNRLLRNADLFKTAQEVVKTKDAFSEIAITEQGLVVQDASGKINTLTPEEYANLKPEEKAKLRWLTNEGLINEREYNPALLYDVQSFHSLASSTSFKELSGEVQNIMSAITTSSQSYTSDAYTDQTGVLKKGLDRLKLISSEPIDNIKSLIETEDNVSSVNLALSAMWEQIGDNGRTFLKARAAISGLTPQEIDSWAKSYLVKMISPKMQKNTTQSLTTDLGTTKKGDGDAGDGTTGKEEFGYWEQVASDRMNSTPEFLAPEGTSLAYKVDQRIYGAMRNKEGNVYEHIPLSDVNELQSLTKKEQASFGGDITLGTSLQKGIIYHGGTLSRVKLPFKMVDGTPVPDILNLSKYEKLLAQITKEQKAGKKLTVGEKQKIFASFGFNNLDINGNPANIYDFYSVPVLVTEYLYDKLDESSQKLLQEVDDEGAKVIRNQTYLSTTKVNDGLYDEDDDVYRGTIFLASRPQAGLGSGTIEDGDKVKLGEWKTKTFNYQTLSGEINPAVTQPFNLDFLKTAIQNAK